MRASSWRRRAISLSSRARSAATSISRRAAPSASGRRRVCIAAGGGSTPSASHSTRSSFAIRFSSDSVAARRSRSALPPPCSSSGSVWPGLMFISPRMVRTASTTPFSHSIAASANGSVGEIGRLRVGRQHHRFASNPGEGRNAAPQRVGDERNDRVRGAQQHFEHLQQRAPRAALDLRRPRPRPTTAASSVRGTSRSIRARRSRR